MYKFTKNEMYIARRKSNIYKAYNTKFNKREVRR